MITSQDNNKHYYFSTYSCSRDAIGRGEDQRKKNLRLGVLGAKPTGAHGFYHV
jgi:hypothetical protein